MSKLINKSFGAFDALNFAIDEINSLKEELEEKRDELNGDEFSGTVEEYNEAIEELELMYSDAPDPYSMEFSKYPVEAQVREGSLTMAQRYQNVLTILKAVAYVADNVIDSTEEIKTQIEEMTEYDNVNFPE